MPRRLSRSMIFYLRFVFLAGSFVTANSAEFESSIERIETIQGRKSLVGFAFRRSTPAPVRIQVYLDRPPAAKGTLLGNFEANLFREDVRSALGSPTANTGFRWEIPANLANSGRRVYLCLEKPRELLKSSIADADGGISLIDTTIPLGNLEGVVTQGTDQIATGWAWLPGIAPESIRVDLYTDNLPGAGGIFVGSAMISGPRAALADKLGLANSTLGFAIPLPPRLRCSGRRLFAFAVDPNESAKMLGFGSSGGAAPIRIPFDSQLSDSFGIVRELSWSPGIASPRRVRALSESPWIQANTFEDESGGDSGSKGAWLAFTSMETAQFLPVRPQKSMDALLPTDPVFRLTASRTLEDRWSFRLNMDKRPQRTIDGFATYPTFLFGGINDSFDMNASEIARPSVGENVYVDIEYRVTDLRTWNVPGLDPSRVRLTLGAKTGFLRQAGGTEGEVSNFTEVNLERTQTFDLCPARGLAYRYLNLPRGVPRDGSDPKGIYDMRHFWGPNESERIVGSSLGELVYYDRRALSAVIRESRTADGWTRLRIPLSYLIANYGWSRDPNDWDNVEIGGIYLGIEIWGKGVMIAEVRDYRAYATSELVPKTPKAE